MAGGWGRGADKALPYMDECGLCGGIGHAEGGTAGLARGDGSGRWGDHGGVCDCEAKAGALGDGALGEGPGRHGVFPYEGDTRSSARGRAGRQ